MLVRLRSTVLAWGGALVLTVSATGLVAAATLVGDTTTTTDTQVTTPTTPTTFTDTNGDGIDDTCQAAVVADPAAADAALKAADANGDGKISVSEAAQTDWTGGPNCNHGGYVSSVARVSGDACATGTAGSTETPDSSETGDQGKDANEAADQAPEADAGDCSTDTTDPTTAQSGAPTVCNTTTPAAPTAPAADGQAPTDVAPNAHGLAVSTVAQDETAIGGKNCNHGGAVSEAAHQGKDHAGPHGNATRQPKGKGHRWGHNKP
jgi:hypothetical protein